jgi:hypothetical protein
MPLHFPSREDTECSTCGRLGHNSRECDFYSRLFARLAFFLPVRFT